MPLDFFVLYAAGAGLLGSPAQGNYAAANACLDALAHHRWAHGLPALSIDWGAFSEVGLAAAQDNRGARLDSRGMRSLTPAEGLTVLERLLASSEPQVGGGAAEPAAVGSVQPGRRRIPDAVASVGRRAVRKRPTRWRPESAGANRKSRSGCAG